MATFASGFIRPGVYVKQTSGQSAAQLPSSFISTVIGHGSDRFTITAKEIKSGAGASDILDDARNVVSISELKVNNIAVTSGFSLVNNGALPFGTASILWSAGKPAAGKSYYVTYIAYKNPTTDYAVGLFNDDMAGMLNYHGAPAQTADEILNGVYIANNISLAADAVKGNGAVSWYAAQLNPFNESTLGVTGALGTSTGATGPAGSTFTSLALNINDDGAQTITLTAGITGAAMAAEIQAAVTALIAANPAKQAAYDKFTAEYSSNQFVLTSGMVGNISSVVVSAGSLATALKLGTAAGGTELVGSGPTLLDLTDEAGLYTATQQVLAKLELIDTWLIVPGFPTMIGGVNASIIPLLKAHVAAMRDITTQKFRVALFSAQKNTDTGTNPEAKYISTQAALGTKALGVVAPSTGKYTYGGVDFTVDGWMIAAAEAGVMTNPVYGAGEPIAGKELVGFSEIKDVFNTTQKNLMGTAGVMMVDNELGVPAIIMDLTTNQASSVESQFKFTRAGDYVAKSLRLILRKLYINVNNLGDATLSNIQTTVKMILQQMVWLHIINDFSDPKATKNGADPRQVDLVVAIQLVPDVSWIYVNLGVNL